MTQRYTSAQAIVALETHGYGFSYIGVENTVALFEGKSSETMITALHDHGDYSAIACLFRELFSDSEKLDYVHQFYADDHGCYDNLFPSNK